MRLPKEEGEKPNFWPMGRKGGAANQNEEVKRRRHRVFHPPGVQEARKMNFHYRGWARRKERSEEWRAKENQKPNLSCERGEERNCGLTGEKNRWSYKNTR